MEFISRVLKYLFWLLVVSWSVALLRRLVTRMVDGATQPGSTSEAAANGAGANAAPNGTAARRLVRDPVCGMHVAEELAIPLGEGGEVTHFCSIACREKYSNAAGRESLSNSAPAKAANA